MFAFESLYEKLKKAQKWFPIIGIVLFVYVVSSIDLRVVRDLLKESNTIYFIVGVVLVFISLFVKCCRHFIILRSQCVNISFYNSVQIYFKSIFWGLASPGRIGEFSKVLYLKEHVRSNITSIANVVIDRIFDLISILVILVVSLIFVEMPHKQEWMAVLIGGCVAFAVLLFLLKKNAQKIQKWKWTRIVDFFNEIYLLKKKSIIFAVSVVSLVIYYAGLFALARGIGIVADFSFIVFCCAASNLIAIIPISFAGIGTRDMFLVYMFGTASFSAEQAVIFSSFFVLIYLMVMGVSYLFILGDGMTGRNPGQRVGRS